MHHNLVPETYKQHSIVGRKLLAGLGGEIWTLRKAVYRPPETRFVIFAQGRTGSTLLTSTLDQHSRIRCEDEILRRPRLFPLWFVENAARGAGTASCFGYHVKIQQLAAWQRVVDAESFLKALHDRGWKIIYLWRYNVICHVVSNIYAETLGAYHRWSDEQNRQNSCTVHLPIWRLHRDIDQRLRARDAERAALRELPHLELIYERDLQNQGTQHLTFQNVQHFLNLSLEPLVPRLHKSVDRPLCDVIENYNEVMAELKNTPYEKFLRDN